MAGNLQIPATVVVTALDAFPLMNRNLNFLEPSDVWTGISMLPSNAVSTPDLSAKSTEALSKTDSLLSAMNDVRSMETSIHFLASSVAKLTPVMASPVHIAVQSSPSFILMESADVSSS